MKHQEQWMKKILSGSCLKLSPSLRKFKAVWNPKCVNAGLRTCHKVWHAAWDLRMKSTKQHGQQGNKSTSCKVHGVIKQSKCATAFPKYLLRYNATFLQSANPAQTKLNSFKTKDWSNDFMVTKVEKRKCMIMYIHLRATASKVEKLAARDTIQSSNHTYKDSVVISFTLMVEMT